MSISTKPTLYTPDDFLKIKKTYILSNNLELDNLLNSLFNLNKKKNYFKTEYSIEEQKKNEIISYLNKITNKNFDDIVKIIYTICTHQQLTNFLIENIFKLALNQSIYCGFYVKIIKYFLDNINNREVINKYILDKCSEFKKLSQTKIIKNNENLSYEEFCENNKLKIYKKGYSQFLGELFLNKIIDYKIIIETLNNLINNLKMVINSNRTLLFGNINQYNEVYVSQLNKIYKVDYFEGVLETFTGHWINKSNPILPLLENDEFDIEILNLDISKKRNCASISHKDLVNDNNFSTLRNAFFDLYASDIKNNWEEAINARSQKMKIVFTNSITKKIIFDVIIWKKDHLVYLSKATGGVNFVIPNSVYDNVSIYCKK